MDDASTVASRTRPLDERAAAARRPITHAAADRHSRRVRILKIVLPSLGVVALLSVAVLGWAKMHFASGVDVKNVLFSKDGLTMVEPRLSGRAQGRTYDVSAARASQSVADPKVVRMEVVDGHVELDDGTSVKIVAAKGVYDGNRETLRLEDGITISDSKGWRAEGPSADVDLLGGRVAARAGVAISGPGATLAADALDLTDNGHRALFTGNVRVTIRPGAPEAEVDPTPVSQTP
jgi:lipopolysaccharide export system protein LptC